MAIRTSSGTGKTHSSPFAFGSAVGTGDQLIVANGHTVTRDGPLDLGANPPQTPTTNPSISLSAGATVTSLASGTYQFRYTFVDAGGGESHPTANISSGAIVNGTSKPRVTVPANPAGIVSKNLYLSAAGGAAGTETLYATGITGTTYDLVSASWTDGTTTQAAAAALPNKAALQILAGGNWVEGDASILTARGDVIDGATSGNSTFTVNGGGTLQFSPANANSPTNAAYRLVLGNFNNFGTNFAKLLSSGTTQSVPYTIETESGSYAPAYIARGVTNVGGAVDSAFVDVSWVDLVRIGSSSVPAVQITPSSIAQTFKWQGGRLDTCGVVDTGNPPTNSTIRVRSITTKNTVGVVSGTVRPFNIRGNSAIGTGERHLGGCVFDEQVLFTDKRDWSIGEIVAGDGWGNLFYKGYSNIGSNVAASFIGNFTRPQSASDEQPMAAAQTDRMYCLADYADLNPHLFGGGYATTNRVTRSVYEYTGSDDNGDCILHMTQAQIYELDYCIITKNGAGTGASGTLLTSGAGIASQKLRARHCTAWVSNQSAVSYGEGAGTIAGQIDEVKSNLILVIPGTSATTSAPFVAIDIFAGGVTDVMAPAGASHNCFAGGVVGTGGSGVVGAWYKGTFSTPPGANDIGLASAAAVGLIDGDARVAEWDTSLGGSGSRATRNAHALAELMKRNDTSGYDSRYSINALLDFIFYSFSPTNTAVRNAGHDGITIGASEGVWPPDLNLTVALAPATLSATAAVTVTAASAITLAPATASGSAAVAITATLGVALGAATLTAETVTGSGNTANLTVTLDAATLDATAAVLVSASAVVTLGAATLTAATQIVVISDMQPGGAFRRAIPTWPRTWRYRPVLATESLALVAAESDDRDYVFDLSQCPELRGGLAVVSGEIAGGSGLTIGPALVLDDEFDGILPGQGLSVRISGGDAGTTYKLACKATLSNGRTVVVPGKLVKVADYEA